MLVAPHHKVQKVRQRALRDRVLGLMPPVDAVLVEHEEVEAGVASSGRGDPRDAGRVGEVGRGVVVPPGPLAGGAVGVGGGSLGGAVASLLLFIAAVAVAGRRVPVVGVAAVFVIRSGDGRRRRPSQPAKHPRHALVPDRPQPVERHADAALGQHDRRERQRAGAGAHQRLLAKVVDEPSSGEHVDGGQVVRASRVVVVSVDGEHREADMDVCGLGPEVGGAVSIFCC